MRRFPPPPAASSSFTTPSRPTPRSKESPMNVEWETPRSYPNSSFGKAAASLSVEDGERAKKRTHYEAMDVDTPPPRPLATAQFPIGAETSSMDTSPYKFETPEMEGESEEGKLEFEGGSFVPLDAFGLDVKVVEKEEAKGKSGEGKGGKGKEVEERGMTTVDGFKGEPRRRRGRKERRGEEEEKEEGGLLGRMGRMASKEFSFQVHHHHASGSNGLNEGEVSAPRGKWLNKSTPYVLLGYLQFGSLALLSLLVLSLSILFLYTLYTDIQSRLASLTLEIRTEILQCAKAYVDNRCEPSTRIPAMERKCSGWEECMGRDVVVGGKSRVVAETLAEVVNGFVDVISVKTMLFVVLTLGLTIYGSSVALSILPSRSPSPPQHYPHPSQAPPHFQHLGYQYPAYGQLPPPGYGAGWEQGAGEYEEGSRTQGRAARKIGG